MPGQVRPPGPAAIAGPVIVAAGPPSGTVAGVRGVRTGSGREGCAVQVLCSHPVPAGHQILLRLPAGTRVLVGFVDEPVARDITALAADLCLIGLVARMEARVTGAVEPAEQVHAGTVRFDSPGGGADVSATYVHPSLGAGVDVPADEALALITLGVTVQLTAGVAAEAADVPDSPAGLDG